MSDYFTTDELAEFLRVKPRKIYDLVSKEEVPFSRVMGKLLFSKEEVANWIAGNNNSVENKNYLPDVILGSHDPLLEYAIKKSGSGIALSFDGSNKGLERFKLNQGIASGLHIYNFSSKKWNIPSVEKYLNDTLKNNLNNPSKKLIIYSKNNIDSLVFYTINSEQDDDTNDYNIKRKIAIKNNEDICLVQDYVFNKVLINIDDFY